MGNEITLSSSSSDFFVHDFWRAMCPHCGAEVLLTPETLVTCRYCGKVWKPIVLLLAPNQDISLPFDWDSEVNSIKEEKESIEEQIATQFDKPLPSVSIKTFATILADGNSAIWTWKLEKEDA